MGNTADILCTSLACTSGGKFQVRVATSGLIVKFSHHTSSSKNTFSTIKSPIDVGNSSNTIRVFLNSDAIYDNYKCVPLDDLFICATSGGKFQVRVATSGLIVKFSLMNNVFSNLTTLLQVVTTLTKLR
jgi:hypothetical protein